MKSILEDSDLIKRLQKGDVGAFDLIYAKYSGKLYIFGLKYLRSTAEAKELVQSVFLKVWENHKNLKKELSFKSYVFTIAYNDICKLLRKRNYHQKFINDTLFENPRSSFEIEKRIDDQSILERVQQIVDKLPKRDRTIFYERQEEGKSTKEIASELNLSPGTIDNYISKTMKLIRSRLRNEDYALLLFLSLFLL